MNELGKFYNKGEVDFSTIVPAYQEAFSGWPWFEKSKCVDSNRPQRCAGGLSRLALNETCSVCGCIPTQPAYEPSELVERFKTLEVSRPTKWYMESLGKEIALVSLAWQATPERVATEKYSDVPEMQSWLADKFPDGPIIWLDEVFADKKVRTSGNLCNFRHICSGFMRAFNNSQLVYRTINPSMVRVAKRDFDVDPFESVPDRRSLIIIRGKK